MNSTQYAFRSPTQARNFTVITAYFAQYGSVPSYRVTARLLGFRSKTTSIKALRVLVKDGLLVRRQTPGGRDILVPAGVKVRNKRGKKSPKVPKQAKKRIETPCLDSENALEGQQSGQKVEKSAKKGKMTESPTTALITNHPLDSTGFSRK